jgi:hypothetical protein
VQQPADAKRHVDALRAFRSESPRRHIPFVVMVSVPHIPDDPHFDLSGSRLQDVMGEHADAGVDVLMIDDRTRESRAIVELAALGAAALH